MRNSYLFVLLSFVFISISSCDDDLEVSNEKSTFQKLINIDVGHYWIYEKSVESIGQVDSIQLVYDTVKVVKSSIQEGHVVYEVSGEFEIDAPFRESIMIFDSSNYLMYYPSREVLFTTDQDFIETIDNPFMGGSVKIKEAIESISVPAGTFETRNLAGVFESKETDYPHGTLNSNLYFASETGCIQNDAQFYSTGHKIIRRLFEFGEE